MKRKIRAFAATGGLLIALSAVTPASAQKPGGVLKIYHRDSPASMSIDPRRGDQLDRDPDDGRLQQSRPLQAGRGAEQSAIDHSGSRHRLVMERGRQRTDVPATSRCQMARRPTLYREGRQMHLGPAAWQVAGEAARQSTQCVVSEPRS